MVSMKKIDHEKIDNEIRDLIRDLNEHGYTTDYCCSGHEERDYWYILFREMPRRTDEVNLVYFLKMVQEDICWDTNDKTKEFFHWRFKFRVDFSFNEHTRQWLRRVYVGSNGIISWEERRYHWKMIRKVLRECE